MNKQKLKNFICDIIDEYSSSNANSHWSLDRDIMTLLAKYKSNEQDKTQETSLGKIYKEYNDFKCVTNTDIYKLRDAVNKLIENNNLLKEYTDALNFISWFDWNNINSYTLRDECEKTLIKDIDKKVTDSFNNINKVYCSHTNTGLITSHGELNIDPSLYNNFYTPIVTTSLNTNSLQDNFNTTTIKVDENTTVSINKNKKPSVDEKEYVKALVAAPYLYSIEDVCNVAYFLKEKIKIDKMTTKYRG